ncbi:MAG: hypothetical protein F7C38_01450 [Desulfurococcales archaeon]|nr:hypothetical protein [Desulfurococcales archaeon]
MADITILKEKLDKLLEKFKKGDRKGLVLAMLAAIRLSDKGEKISPENVASEAKALMDEHPDIDWGVSREDLTPGLASTLLQELADMGLLEATDTLTYRLKPYKSGDPRAEVLARFGYLIFYGGPAR